MRSMIAGSSRLRPEPMTIETSWTVVGVALPAEQVLDDGLALAGRDLVVAQGVAQLVAGLVRAGEAEQLVLDLVERALGSRHLEQAAGVAVDAAVHCVPRPRRPLLAARSLALAARTRQPCRSLRPAPAAGRPAGCSPRSAVAGPNRRASARRPARRRRWRSARSRPRSSSVTRSLPAAMSASAFASSSEISAASRARPSASNDSAWVSASDRMRRRSLSMSPRAVRTWLALASACA